MISQEQRDGLLRTIHEGMEARNAMSNEQRENKFVKHLLILLLVIFQKVKHVH